MMCDARLTPQSRQVLLEACDDVSCATLPTAGKRLTNHRYIDSESMQLAMTPGWNCQYLQINLGNTARHDEIFTPPTEWQGVERDWKRFDYVFDFSGETGFDKAELVSGAMQRDRGPIALGPRTPSHPGRPAASLTWQVDKPA